MSFRTLALRAGFEALVRLGAHRMAPLRDEGIGLILTLHHVRPAPATDFQPHRELEVTPDFLDDALGAMRSTGIEFVTLDEASRRLARPGEGGRFAAVTLDDGYRDNRDYALPVFRRHAVPFTVFATTGFVRRETMLWWKVVEEVVGGAPAVTFPMEGEPVRFATGTVAEKTAAVRRISAWARTADPAVVFDRIGRLAAAHGVDPLEPTRRETLAADELAAFAADPLVTIGAHTRSHPNLRRLDEAAALAEMAGGADELAGLLGTRPRFFAYPYGSSAAAGAREFMLARRAGFDLAVTTRPGMLHPDHDRHRTALPRISLNGYFQSLRHLEVLLSGLPFRLLNGFRRLDVA